MKVIKVKDPLYGQNITAILGCTHKQLENYLSSKYNYTLDREDHASGEQFAISCNVHAGEKRFFVWTQGSASNWLEVGVLAHETLHLTFSVLEHVGMQKSEESEEAFTYFFEEIFCNVLKKLYKDDRKTIQVRGVSKDAKRTKKPARKSKV